MLEKIKKIFPDPNKSPEGETSNQILNGLRDVCQKAASTAGWETRPSGPRILQKQGQKTGEVLIINGLNVVSVGGPFVDYEQEYVWVASLYENPRKLLVISMNWPEEIDLDQKNWKSELASAIIKGCNSPGKLVDIEMVGPTFHHR